MIQIYIELLVNNTQIENYCKKMTSGLIDNFGRKVLIVRDSEQHDKRNSEMIVQF